MTAARSRLLPILVPCLLSLPLIAHAAEKNRITGIAPACAAPGEQVTITGFGFGAHNARVTVGDFPAVIVATTDVQIRFIVPAAPSGATTVRLGHRLGSQQGSIEFRVGCGYQPPEGEVLPGAPGAPAVSAMVEKLPVGVDPSQIEGGVIMTRIDLWITPSTTTGQLNAALERVNGGIVTMLPGLPAMTIAVPRAASFDALLQTTQTLKESPGISAADPAMTAEADILPEGPAGSQDADIDHLMTTRFPAAWNAKSLASRACTTPRVTVLVMDRFAVPRPSTHFAFTSEIPNMQILEGSSPSEEEEAPLRVHGYDVTTTMAAMFNATSPTGANPFPDCLEIVGVQAAGLSFVELLVRLSTALPADRFILNISMAFRTCNADACIAGLIRPVERARIASLYKTLTHDRWEDFLATTAAGNNGNKLQARVYRGMGRALFSSPWNLSTSPDPLFGSVRDPLLWSPLQAGLFDPIVAGETEALELLEFLRGEGADIIGPSDNILITGSVRDAGSPPSQRYEDLEESAFSDTDPDVYAIGEDVFVFLRQSVNGTSFSAPQVAGLASYLWLLSDDLRNQPARVTKQAILSNARVVQSPERSLPVIDAYATILSLDEAVLPNPVSAPVRLAILDVVENGRFDEADIEKFLAEFPPPGTANLDYSRHDLNGDGFTGDNPLGIPVPFDLDRVGSTRFGAPRLSEVGQLILGAAVTFNENNLDDRQILCYYAYSDLYTGDLERRNVLLAGSGCAPITVAIDPGAACVQLGQTQQFAADVNGIGDPRVTWELPSGGGSITGTGLFTAGSTPGVFTVRATSLAAPLASGEAQVFVTSGAPPPGCPSTEFVQFLSVLVGAGGATKTIDCRVPSCDQFTIPLDLTLEETSECGASIHATLRKSGNTVTLDADADACRDATETHAGAGTWFHVEMRTTVPSFATGVTISLNPDWPTDNRGYALLQGVGAGLGATYEESNGQVLTNFPTRSAELAVGKDTTTVGFRFGIGAPLGVTSMSGRGRVGTVTFGTAGQSNEARATSIPAPIAPPGASTAARPALEFGASAYPNPASSSTLILYSIPQDLDRSHVEVSIFDIRGRRVRTLVSGVRGFGQHAADWDLRDESGLPVGNGMYFSRLKVGGRQKILRLLVVGRSFVGTR